MSCVYVDWLLAGSGWMHGPQNIKKKLVAIQAAFTKSDLIK